MQALTTRWIGGLAWPGSGNLVPAGRRGVARLHRQPVWRTAGVLATLPRGAGLAASVLYLLAWGAYGMVLSGKTADVLNDTTAELGFKVAAVRITGQRELDEIDVLDTLSIHSGQSLFFYDAAAARQRLADNPWISDVSVMKFYPDKLRVIIEERVPAALWQKSLADPVEIIDGEGKIITDRLDPRFVSLPRVIGDGAETRVHEISALLDDVPTLQTKVRAAMLVSHRRWDLFLDNGVQVMLPEKDPEKAVAELDRMDKQAGLTGRAITLIDLRLPDRVVVRLTDDAEAARDALIKAREKAMKQRLRDA